MQPTPVVCNDPKYGGLNMINVQHMQTAFIIKWVTDVNEETQEKWKAIPRFLYSQLGANATCFKTNQSVKKFIGLTDVKSMFWQRALKVWLEQKSNVGEQVSTSVHNQLLWNNENIVYHGKSLFIKDWIANHILYVEDIIDNENMISYENICQKLGYTPNRLFEYNAVCTAVKALLSRGLQNGFHYALPFGTSAKSIRLK